MIAPTLTILDAPAEPASAMSETIIEARLGLLFGSLCHARRETVLWFADAFPTIVDDAGLAGDEWADLVRALLQMANTGLAPASAHLEALCSMSRWSLTDLHTRTAYVDPLPIRNVLAHTAREVLDHLRRRELALTAVSSVRRSLLNNQAPARGDVAAIEIEVDR